jgi:hypothetical protein
VIVLGMLQSGLLWAAALGVCVTGCGAALPAAQIQCRLAALEVLPEDPMQVTVYDAVDVVERLRACSAPKDGGVP